MSRFFVDNLEKLGQAKRYRRYDQFTRLLLGKRKLWEVVPFFIPDPIENIIHEV